jgi:hypothetical protein
MANSTLISPTEVIAKGHFGHNYDSLLLCSHIVIAEEKFLRSADACFGDKLYLQLLADTVSYTDFDATVSYAVGHCVIYEGRLYRCVVAAAGSLPSDAAYWAGTYKFATPLFQLLWDSYLWQYLALGVQHASTFKSAYRSSSKGIVRLEAEHVRAAEYAGIKALKEELLDNMGVLKAAMHRFLAAHQSAFPSYVAVQECSSGNKPGTTAGIGLFVRSNDGP